MPNLSAPVEMNFILWTIAVIVVTSIVGIIVVKIKKV